MVKSPGAYRWTSYQANAQGKDNEIINYPPLFHSLGKTKAQRLDAYKSLLKLPIDEKQPGLIRAAWLTGTPLGNDYFKQKVEMQSWSSRTWTP